MKKVSLALGGLFIALTAFVTTDHKKDNFKAFLAEMDPVVLPYEITIADLAPKGEEEAFGDLDYLAKMNRFREFIPELKTGRFSRMGPPTVELLAKMELSEEVTGVIYATHHRFRYYGANFMLALYDKNGNLLDYEGKKKSKKKKRKGFFAADDIPDSFLLAYQSFEDAQTARIDENGQIFLQYMTSKWEKDVTEYGIEDNTIVGYDLVRSEAYQLNPNGRIDKADLPVASEARASLK